ncbi:NucA/NucB deoxyribonuclease domain-containing protein [Cellulomonas hominis]
MPGSGWITPIHRLVNPTLQNLNRTTACLASFPRPNLKTCDEYPFASTWEGAYTGGDTPRTQPWCQITLAGPPSTGPTGFSVCMIDGSENSSAGSVMNSYLFVPARVIDGDAFYIGAY